MRVTALFKLGGDVEETVFGAEDGHVRTHAVAEIDAGNHFLRGNIDDHQVAAVGSRHAHAGVSVDGHVGQAAVSRRNHFMACNATLLDGCDHLSGDGIDDGQAPVSLLGHKQAVLLGEPCGNRQRKQKNTNGQSGGIHGNLLKIRKDYIPKNNRRFFTYHPQTEKRLGPLALRMTSSILFRMILS